MKITKCKSEIVVSNDYPGILSSRVEYKVASATATMQWLGPRIDKVEWAKVLAFFKWTYNTAKSESQVRFYLNPTEKRWVAWAFPQKANTGMSAQELDTPEAQTQRAQFPDGTWQYLMTVHHHCSSGAFQSGTDERNEHDQDGLHITIGNMDKDRHDIHCRFYLSKNCYEPDMSMFWDIGDDIRTMTPPNIWNDIARYQMCQHVEAEYPQQWKDNYIEVKGVYQSGPWSPGTFWRGHGSNGQWINGIWHPDQAPVSQAPQNGTPVGAQEKPTGQNLPSGMKSAMERAEDAFADLKCMGWTEEDLKVVVENTINGGFETEDPQLYFDMETVLADNEVTLQLLLREIRWRVSAWERKQAETKPVDDADIGNWGGAMDHGGYGYGM